VVGNDDDDDDERFAVVAENSGRFTVVVSQEASEVADSQEALRGSLYVAGPLVVLLIGTATWLLVGRALAPVEAIRVEVDRITADRLGRRVPQPAARDEIGDLARTMNQMLERLESARARQQQLVADASHELRSPATVIRQRAEVALTHPERTTTAELARVTLAEGRRIEQLVEQLLWLARADEQSTGLRLRLLDLDDLVLEEANRVRTINDLAVDTTRVSGGQVCGDALMMRRVAANLLDNAVAHATSTVSVALFERDDEVVLRVDDDGPGIAVEDRERVLERFVRLDEARSRTRGGAGLGLAIVHGIVTAHEGSVRVGTSESGGARFDVVLPRPG
jgi:signal transduction histidine kinase